MFSLYQVTLLLLVFSIIITKLAFALNHCFYVSKTLKLPFHKLLIKSTKIFALSQKWEVAEPVCRYFICFLLFL